MPKAVNLCILPNGPLQEFQLTPQECNGLAQAFQIRGASLRVFFLRILAVARAIILSGRRLDDLVDDVPSEVPGLITFGHGISRFCERN